MKNIKLEIMLCRIAIAFQSIIIAFKFVVGVVGGIIEGFGQLMSPYIIASRIFGGKDIDDFEIYSFKIIDSTEKNFDILDSLKDRIKKNKIKLIEGNTSKEPDPLVTIPASRETEPIKDNLVQDTYHIEETSPIKDKPKVKKIGARKK